MICKTGSLANIYFQKSPSLKVMAFAVLEFWGISWLYVENIPSPIPVRTGLNNWKHEIVPFNWST